MTYNYICKRHLKSNSQFQTTIIIEVFIQDSALIYISMWESGYASLQLKVFFFIKESIKLPKKSLWDNLCLIYFLRDMALFLLP